MDISRRDGAVSALVEEMHASRKKRLLKLSLSQADAEEVSALHTQAPARNSSLRSADDETIRRCFRKLRAKNG
jgi:hypothetical protein